jgi:TolB protein
MMVAPTVDAAVPGRDGLIAFTRSVFPESSQIYVVRPNGRGLRQLTHRRRGAIAPAWSPGGKRIAFTAPGRLSPLHVFVKRLGGGVRQLTHGKDAFMQPTWSPDGRWIAAIRGRWVRGRSHESLVAVRADGSRIRVVFTGRELSLEYPAWSPDGRSIAFVKTDIDLQGADPNIYVVPAERGAARKIDRSDSQEQPDWSPDGRLIAYSWGFGLGWDDIHVIHPDGTGDRALTDDVSIVGEGWPAWAPSGRRLAIARLGGIWTLAADGSRLRRLTNPRGTAGDLDPSWQPR